MEENDILNMDAIEEDEETRTRTGKEIKKLKGGAKVKALVRNDINADIASVAGMAGPIVTYEQFKKSIGRPPLYKPNTHPAAIFELMAPPYCFSKEIAGMRLGIGRSTIYEWIDKYEAFADAVRAGIMVAEEYHAGRLGSGTVKYAQGLIFYMKNRHSWKDKTEIEHSRKVDDLVKDGETEAQRVNWQDIAPTGNNASGQVIDAEIVEEDDED